MIKITCSRCGYEWNYKGTSPYYSSCPRCRKTIKIKSFNENDTSLELLQ